MMTVSRLFQTLTPVCLLAVFSITGWAQEEETNLLENGDFEKSFKEEDNLLDGVNSKNELQLPTHRVPVVGSEGNLSRSDVPPGVALVDLNKDGKMDVVASSPVGHYYAYFNKSEDPAKPTFTQAEIFPIFLSLSLQPGGVLNQGHEYERRAPRMSFFSWTGGGGLDMTVGNLYGELFLIPGSNSPARVEYRQPRDYAAAEIPTSSIEGRYWGNLFSPVVMDFVPGGGPEIVMGEGSYSANSVFLLYSDSAVMPPRFDANSRYFLVVGEGREQLVPTVIDVNEDGLLDVLVADKVGKITVHLQPDGWKPQDGPLNTVENASTSVLSIGGKDQLNSPTSISANDYNGDGLFDLLVGKSNGELHIAINSGSKGEPKFAKLEAIKGEDKWGKGSITNVPDWDVDVDRIDGNPLGYWKIEPRGERGDDDKEQHMLKGAFFQPYNQIVVGDIVPNLANEDIYYRASQKFSFKNGERYTIEFDVKGNRIDDFVVHYYGHITGRDLGPVNTDERGGVSADQRNAREWLDEEVGRSSVGPQWQSRRFTFTPRPDDRRLRDLENLGLRIAFKGILSGPDSEIYIDNVRMYRR